MKKIFYLSIAVIGFLLCTHSNIVAQGGVSISPSGNPADNSSGLDVRSHDKGALLPRMNSTSRDNISNPATGLIIYNTDCEVYNYNAGTPASPNWVTIPGSNTIQAGVSVTSNPSGASVCTGTSVTFTATPANGITSQSYQWKVNGGNVGSNSANYTYSPSNNDIVSCVLTTGQNCVVGSPATSSVTVPVYTTPGTPGTITSSAVTCQNASTTYSIAAVSGATSYNWLVPPHATINSGQGTSALGVSFDGTYGNIGHVAVSAQNECGISGSDTATIFIHYEIPVTPPAPSGTVYGFDNTSYSYTSGSVTNATTYLWTVPGDASVSSGQGSTSATVAFGVTSGNVCIESGNICGYSAPACTDVNVCAISHGTQTFSYNGNVQTFSVPCATTVTLAVYGAAGGNAGCCSYGYGGEATGSLSVTPNEPLYLYCGGQGGYYYSPGWNGGGYGGYNGGYAGGGATDIRVGGQSYSNRIIIGGGGGGTSSGYGSFGGGGGGTSGGNGTETNLYGYSYSCNCQEFGCGSCVCGIYAGGGYGGSQSGGGSGGSYNAQGCTGGWNGQTGNLGTGGNQNEGDPYYDGGGGGGYFGGGSGSTVQASYWSSSGGGGSSYTGGVTAGTTTPGVNSGSGYLTITW